MKRPGLLAALARAAPGRRGFLMARLQERLAGRRAALLGPGSGAVLDASPGLASWPLPPGVTAVRDLAYGDDPLQRLDVYRPPEAQAAPVILYVHGGGWRRGDKAMPRMVRNKLAHWSAKGYVFVSTNHRLVPQACVLEQARDVARALAFVQAKAGAWGGDARRVVLMGHSAGAHLAALVTADSALAAEEGLRPWLATIALDSAALDMVAIMERPHYRFYDPVFGTDPALWRAASPLHRLQGPPAAPMLLVCSSLRDDSEPAARAFAAKAAGFGFGGASILPVALDHGELNDRLGLPGDYTEAVDDFLRSLGLH